MRNEIYNLLDEMIDDVYLHFQAKLNIKHADITPMQALRQDEILDELTEIINEVLEMEVKLDETYGCHFADDAEKMADFLTMSKDDFLQSYSYLTEADYETTAREVAKRISKMISNVR